MSSRGLFARVSRGLPGDQRALAGSLGSLFTFIVLSAAACTEPTFSEVDAEIEETKVVEDARVSTREPDAARAPRDSAGAPDTIRDAGDEDASTASSASSAGESDAGARDASTPTDAATPADAGAPVAQADASSPGPFPEWAEPLFGLYFKRSVTFSYDDAALQGPINTRNVEYSLVTIAKNGREIDVSIQLCEVSMAWAGTGKVPTYKFKMPSALPPMRGHLVLGSVGSFSSEPMVQQIGFDPTRTCSGSGRMSKRTEQTWISGTTCQCSVAALPSAPDDCRVDSDRDGKAGFTLWGEVPPFSPGDGIAVFDFAVTFVDGQVKSTSRHELRELRAQSVACLNPADGCSVGNNVLCPRGSTKLIKAQGATCADLNVGEFGPLDDFPAQVDCRGDAR